MNDRNKHTARPHQDRQRDDVSYNNQRQRQYPHSNNKNSVYQTEDFPPLPAVQDDETSELSANMKQMQSCLLNLMDKQQQQQLQITNMIQNLKFNQEPRSLTNSQPGVTNFTQPLFNHTLTNNAAKN